MSKSFLDDTFKQGDSLINQICDEPLERLRRVGDLWKSQLADLEDLAKAEDSVRREYTGRYLFELLQNANDAILDWYEKNNLSLRDKPEGEHKRVRIQLTSQSLIIGNEGLPFSENNIRALCRLHISTKSASKQIGHKGIGFKSVLEVTDSPEIYSNHFAFGFNRDEFTARAQEITKIDARKISVPILRAPFPRRLSRLHPDEREIIEEFFDQDFVTVIRLPFKNGDIAKKVFEKIQEIITPQLLLFLEAIDQLELYLPTGENYAYWRTTNQIHSKINYREAILWSDQRGAAEIHSRWLVLEPKELLIQDHSLIEGLGEAWEDVHAVRYSAAFPITKNGSDLMLDEQAQPFHVYFPTEEYSGLKFLINADFYLEAARKDIRRCPLNDHLAEEIALYLASEGVGVLKSKFPKNSAIVDILSLSQGKPDRPFANYFYEQYLLVLSDSSFVPLDSGQYKSPAEIRFFPEHVDMDRFGYFFPPSYLRGSEKWAYPMRDVVSQEMKRSNNGLEFLSKMGARTLTKEEVIKSLQMGPPLHIQDHGEFLRFLANWWSNLGYSDQRTFAAELSNCRIMPIGSDWQIPSQSLIFQANLRDEETTQIPEGFDFAVVSLDVYGEDRSYNGITAKFLDAIKIGPYVARDILRRAILPKLRSLDDFHVLQKKYPQSIFDVYRFLKNYFEKEGKISDILSDLRKIPVPAYSNSNPTNQVWLPVGQVYFSKEWSGTDDLEVVFGNVDGVSFLAPIDEIPEISEAGQKTSWYDFFYWLGIAYLPRVVENIDRCTHHSINHHPFSAQKYWSEYAKKYGPVFRCSNSSRNHSFSRVMTRNFRLEHFEEIVLQNDPEKCIRLFQLLGNHWEKYRDKLTTALKCSYTTTGCVGEIIPSYLSYCLTEIKWLPAEVGGKITNRLFCAQDIWNLGEDVRPEVKRMVPSLPKLFQQEPYRSICNDILRSNYSFDDYLGLMQNLPENYPINMGELERDAQKRWQDSIRAVFNWIAQALQNILARSGEENWPIPPTNLRVFAYRANQPDYVLIDNPLLVYPDDPFLGLDWEKELWFLKIDESWASLRAWLHVASLSDVVETEVIQSNKVEDATTRVREKYHQALPYFLSLVRERQFSRYDGNLGRLKRLNIYVYEQLQILQKLQKIQIPAKFISRDVLLQTYDQPGQRGAMILRSGDLNVAASSAENPYIFGDPIASYIEVDRLADAFVLLFQLKTHEDKMSYLKSKGITEETFQIVFNDLKTQSYGEDDSDIHDTLNKLFGQSGDSGGTGTGSSAPKEPNSFGKGTSDTGSGGTTPGSGGSSMDGSIAGGTGNNGNDGSHNRPHGKLRTYVVPPKAESADTSDGDEEGEHRDEVDQAGMARVMSYEREHHRIPQEMPHFNKGFDVQSVDQSENKRYIEVKSLSGLWGERNAPGMTRPQFEYAKRDGDQYWLYVVERATEDDFKIYCIQNPAQRVNQYLFDDGWRELAESED